MSGHQRAEAGVLDEGRRQEAGPLLSVLDAVSATRIGQAVTDEIYVGRQPVLLVVERESLGCRVNGDGS